MDRTSIVIGMCMPFYVVPIAILIIRMMIGTLKMENHVSPHSLQYI